jgi:CheY-like chemotaxis protein
VPGHRALIHRHPSAPGPRGVVLIAEDHGDTREMYEAILGDAGFRCIAASNVEDALRHATTTQFDVAVIDLGLPRMEHGLALARHLQELPKAPSLVALTGHREDQLPKGVFRGYLMKPFDPDALVRAVTRVLNLDADQLRKRAAEMVRSGRLPSRTQARTSRGVGSDCSLCGRAITEEEIEYELHFSGWGRDIPPQAHRFHVICLGAWAVARRETTEE